MIRIYNWKHSRSDFRDKLFSPAPFVSGLPSRVDSLTHDIPAYDQGQLGSCTGNGSARLFQHRLKAEGKNSFIPSRLFIYYNERMIEGTILEDSGAQVRDSMKALHKYGAPPEGLWPYKIERFSKKPDPKTYEAARQDIALSYHSVRATPNGIKSAIASGNPIVFGFTVFESFEGNIVAKTGIMPLPSPKEKQLGGHCVVVDGYDSEYLFCVNSWGTNWGIDGHFKMPWSNLGNCSDFWVLLKVA